MSWITHLGEAELFKAFDLTEFFVRFWRLR